MEERGGTSQQHWARTNACPGPSGRWAWPPWVWFSALSEMLHHLPLLKLHSVWDGPLMPVCGLALSRELLTCVCNRRPETPPGCLTSGVGPTCRKRVSGTSFPHWCSPTPVSWVAHARNVGVFSHQSLLKPKSPSAKSCPLLLLNSALC